MALPLSEIGERIHRVRTSLGVTHEELADALGVDVAALSRIESGTMDPLPGDYILIVARMLNTDFRYFISHDVDDVEDETEQIYRASKTHSRSAHLGASVRPPSASSRFDVTAN